MKRIFITFVTSVLLFHFSLAQKLTLTDLTNLCNKQNWENVNLNLVSKGWTYYDSEKGNSNQYNTITWSFNKELYSDKANAWFYLFTYDGQPNKISYSVFNKESYTIIQNSISTGGYKLIGSEIENNEVISTYSNPNYILKISTEKRTDDDWTDRSITAYNFTLIKKSGVYDVDNGKKREYFDDGTLKFEYILTNGEINGQIKAYYENGQIKKTGYYKNGKGNGAFVEYDEEGNKTSEYNLLDDEMTSLLIKYENKLISTSTNYKGGLKNGPFIDYYHNDDTKELYLIIYGEYLNNEKNGCWKSYYIDNKKERLVKVETYSNGVKNGYFQDVEGDSVIVGNYKDGKLNGEYKIYIDLSRMIVGGVINTNVTELTLITEGYYVDDAQSGYWKYYDYTGTLRHEGRLLNGEKTDDWKYYYSILSTENGIELPYSKELYFIRKFQNNKLNGRSIRFSFLNEEKIPCIRKADTKSVEDSCTKFNYTKVNETSTYNNDKLYGLYEFKDSTNTTIIKGYFKNDLKDGEWFERSKETDEQNNVSYNFEKGYFLNDKREGKWVIYNSDNRITDSFNFKNGELNGETVEWSKINKPVVKKKFENGKMKELTRFDSLGIKLEHKYEIYDENDISYKCRKTDFHEDGYISQEYKLIKTGEIDHNLFETIFVYDAGELSNGTRGYKDGLFKMFNTGNQALITGTYLKENKTGLWTNYYYDQQIRIESNYEKNQKLDEKYFTLIGDLFSGEFIFIDNENNLKEERKIKNGLRNGKTIFADLTTKKTIKKENYKNGVLK